MRVLDIDLDFFIEGAAHGRASDDDRLSADDYPPWPNEKVLSFLEDSCKLESKLPGFVVEHHAEVFACWREAIGAGAMTPPLSVTHLDGHADLGLLDGSYEYLMTELLFLKPDRRQFPKTGPRGLNDGNWLAFAIACRWVGELVYVLNGDGPPDDLFPYYMDNYVSGADREIGFTGRAQNIELVGVTEQQLERVSSPRGDEPFEVKLVEPKVPFSWASFRDFTAPAPFDVVCLARSPAFTPAESDDVFDEIRARFIDEAALRR